MLLYLVWEVKRRVYRILPHLITYPTTLFCLILHVKGYLIFSPNRTNKHSFQRRYELSPRFPKRTTTNKNEQEVPLVKFLCTKLFGEQCAQNEQLTNGANSISTAFETLCSVVRRNWRYTPHLCSHLRHVALYSVFGKRLG